MYLKNESMNLRNIKYVLLALVIFSITFTGCLKDKAFDNNEIQSVHGPETKVIGIVLTAATVNNFLGLAFNNSNTDTVINLIPVTLATHDPAPEDIHITLAVNNQLLTDYNANNGTSFTPAINYTLVSPGGVVTIPKGSNTGYLQIKFKPSNFLGLSSALAFKITNIAENGYTISGNANSGIVAINIKNRYDGHYIVTGTLTDAVNPALSGKYPFEIDFITVGANTNDLFTTTSDIGYGHPISNNGALSLYGSFSPEFIIDPVSNKVTSVVNIYGQPAANGRSAALDPSGINTYDPVTKTIKVSYFLLQPGSAVRTRFTEVFTYLGPR